MAGFSTQRSNFSLDGSKYTQPPEGDINQTNGLVLADSYSPHGAFGMDVSMYQPQPLMAQAPNFQYVLPQHQAPIPAIASTVDPQFAFQHPSLPIAVPSVFEAPATLQAPGRPSQTEYIVSQPQVISMSAPAISVGDWMSNSALQTTASKPDPPVSRTLKKPRQQFSACTACRTRRVKCDLKDVRLEWQKLHHGVDLNALQTLEIAEKEQPFATEGKKKKARPPATEKQNLAAISKVEDVQCTNCYHRETTCIDEFAYRKQNRGKRPAHGMVINKRHSDVHEGESSQSSFTYEDEARFFQSTTTQLDLQNSIPQGDESSSIQRPGLPRLWSGMSEPADLYSASGEPYNVANPSQLDWIHQEPPGKPVTGAPLERSISSLQNLQASSLQQSSSNISSAATDHISKNASMASDPRQTYSYPASVAPSTPKSVSSRGRSRGTTHSHISSREFRIPDLKFSFFESDFYRRFHIQRPLIDPIDFMNRYKAACPYSADSMGPAGAILCHVMYAWACSYGIDESGQMLVTSNEWHIPENTMHPDRQQQYSIRESARQRQLEQTNLAVKQVLKEIDQAGILRNITWDGVRCLLLILPLTEYVSSAAERLAMYECALGQVFSLCSASALGYDGLPAMPSPEQELVRRRLYWYAFVHEGITTGLKGGRMVLDEDELSSLDDVLPQAARSALTSSATYQSVAKFATAPIRLAMACRLVHKALTGAKARRRERVDRKLLNDAWEALEESWIEFDNMKTFSPGPLSRPDDVIKFADGWKIFMFEAHNVIRESLEHRANILANDRDSARLMDLGMAETQGNSHDQILSEIQHLRSIARAKCDYVLREIASIVKQHINTTFFEWDASLVRDGTYYAAILLAETNGSDNDITACLEALSEMRWAFARTQERSQGLHQVWSLQSTSKSFTAHGRSFGNPTQSGNHEQTLDVFNPRTISIYNLDPSVLSVTSISNAESDLLALAMEDDRPMMQGDQMLQAQFQQSPFQQQPFVANSTSTNSTLAIPQTVDHAREHGDKLTGWSGQHVQYVANPRGTAYPYGWQP